MKPKSKGLTEEGKKFMLKDWSIEGYSFKKVYYTRLKELTNKVNEALNHSVITNITQTNRLIKAGVSWVVEHVGTKKLLRKRNLDYGGKKLRVTLK